MPNPCATHPLTPPRVIAIARDRYLQPRHPFPDALNLPGTQAPRYGQDITFGRGRAAPGNKTAGNTPAELKDRMRRLLAIFAGNDGSGMARRLFNRFLTKQSRVQYFDDFALTRAADRHPHIQQFCSRAMSAPTSRWKTTGRIRIHQALKNANWDIRRMRTLTDLGVPAFNAGSKIFTSEDFANGLGLMINGVQHVYIVATHYHYDQQDAKYCLRLRFVFYDVFGLDDDDVREFGASTNDWFPSAAGLGITAWWQLQHQHGYAPLVTRFVLYRNYEVPAQ